LLKILIQAKAAVHKIKPCKQHKGRTKNATGNRLRVRISHNFIPVTMELTLCQHLVTVRKNRVSRMQAKRAAGHVAMVACHSGKL
jgi:hypothetical protein